MLNVNSRGAFDLNRYLNNQLVKKRYGNDSGNNVLIDYYVDLNDQPLVEIGEVKFETMELY